MNEKVVYQTDRYGVFTGEVIAERSPLEADVWLIPAGCVEDAPPAIPEGKAALWNGEYWSLIDCIYGLTAYSIKTGESVQIDRFGTIPTGYTLKVPGPHQVWKNGEWVDDRQAVLERRYSEQYTAIDSTCEQNITAGFTSTALGTQHRYSSQLDDQLNLTGAILRGIDMPYACRDEQGVKAFRLHTAEQLRQVGDDFTQYKLQLLQHTNELKQLLDQALAASDIDAISRISWEPLP